MKKLLSLILAAAMLAGMTTSVFAYTGTEANTYMDSTDVTGLTVITPSNTNAPDTDYVKLVGSNIQTSHTGRGVLLMDGNCESLWSFYGQAGASPTLHIILKKALPLDKVFIAFPWTSDYASNNEFVIGAYGVAAYATYVDGTVERLTYTGNTITSADNARFLELSNKTKAVKMITVSRIPRNTLDAIAGFYDNAPGVLAYQMMSISEVRLYAPTSAISVTENKADAVITKNGEALACLSDGYTAGVAKQLLGQMANPLSSYSDMPALNIGQAHIFDTASWKYTVTAQGVTNEAVLTGDAEVALAAGEYVLVDLGKYSYVSEVEVAADNYEGLTVKGSNMGKAIEDMTAIDGMSALTVNPNGLYSSVDSTPDRYRYIAICNEGENEIKLSEVAVKAGNNDPVITRNKGLRAWYNNTWYEVAEGETVPAANSYVWTQNIKVPVAEGQKYTALLVLYKENGEMIEAVSTEVTMDAAEKKVDLMTGNGSRRAEARKAKLILMDTLTNGMIYQTEEYTIAPVTAAAE